jgi:hypothetical protein
MGFSTVSCIMKYRVSTMSNIHYVVMISNYFCFQVDSPTYHGIKERPHFHKDIAEV